MTEFTSMAVATARIESLESRVAGAELENEVLRKELQLSTAKLQASNALLENMIKHAKDTETAHAARQGDPVFDVHHVKRNSLVKSWPTPRG
jgi:hypothetical protein